MKKKTNIKKKSKIDSEECTIDSYELYDLLLLYMLNNNIKTLKIYQPDEKYGNAKFEIKVARGIDEKGIYIKLKFVEVKKSR